MKNPLRNILLYLFLMLLAVGLYSCKTSEPAIERVPDTGGIIEIDSAQLTSRTERGTDLSMYRNTLSDVYTTQQHDMPENFLQSYEGDKQVERDPFDGFRIQITSTRNVARADSTAKRFRMWADTTIAGYVPNTYVFFKQPFYKVHVGDFHDREKANNFSRIVKRKYPDAWVVHDRINPAQVPADTTEIKLQTGKNKDREDKN